MFAATNVSAATALNILNMATRVEGKGPIYNGPGASKPKSTFLLRTLQLHERECVEQAKKYAMEQSIRAVLLRQTQAQQSIQLNNIRKTQTVALLNRVYVGSISYEVNEESLRAAFSVFGPLKSVSMSWDPATQKHKGFAFLEFEYPEGAHLSIEQMNGLSFGGRNLKVGRPSNLSNADGMIADLVKEYKLDNRIYVSGIHLDLTEDDLSLVFEAFGNIIFCRLLADTTGSQAHRGFGYVEYETFQSANDAVASMNQFNLGGQLLRVCKAMSPPEGVSTTTPTGLPPAAAVAAASVTAKVLSMETEQLPTNASQSNNDIDDGSYNAQMPSTAPGERHHHTSGFDVPPREPPVERVLPPPQTLGSWEADELLDGTSVGQLGIIPLENNGRMTSFSEARIPSPEPSVLILRNMVGPEDCDDELEGEISSECSQYGSVKQVLIDQQPDPNTGDMVVKVFVLYRSLDDVNNAIAALDGRYFAGRQIAADIYDTHAFRSGDLVR